MTFDDAVKALEKIGCDSWTLTRNNGPEMVVEIVIDGVELFGAACGGVETLDEAWSDLLVKLSNHLAPKAAALERMRDIQQTLRAL